MAAEIKLTWNPPTEASGGSATSYQIWRAPNVHTTGAAVVANKDSGFPITHTHSGGATAAQEYDDTSVVFGSIYSYTIKAVNATGPSQNYANPDNATA